VLKLLAFVLPLGLDSLAVAAAIAASRPVSRADRARVSAIFVLFEAGMPLIGLALGSSLARGIGTVADYAAGAIVIGTGAWMLAGGDGDDERKAGRMLTARGPAIIALGLSISMDELAIGFSVGLVRLPLVPLIIAIAVQALIAAQLGLSLGAAISQRLRERAEQLAGVALILLGAFLIAEQLARK
jgi:putative Mn2+ efflux pump MntP